MVMKDTARSPGHTVIEDVSMPLVYSVQSVVTGKLVDIGFWVCMQTSLETILPYLLSTCNNTRSINSNVR